MIIFSMLITGFPIVAYQYYITYSLSKKKKFSFCLVNWLFDLGYKFCETHCLITWSFTTIKCDLWIDLKLLVIQGKKG